MNFDRRISLKEIRTFPIATSGGVSPQMALGAMPVRPALLVRLTDRDGCAGWGEVWANFPPRAHLHKAHLIEDVIAPLLTGFTFTDPAEVGLFLRARLSTYFLHIGQERVFEHALAGLDIALWDLALRTAGRGFAEHMNLEGSSASCYASSINPPDLERFLAKHFALGQTRFKLKIGVDDARDRRFVEKAAALCSRGSRIMIDSNQNWNAAQAMAMLREFESYELLFAEEPLPANASPGEWEALAEATAIPLAAGENIYGVEDFLRMASAGVRYLQPDVAKWGGITGALKLIKQSPDGVFIWPHFMGCAVGQMAALWVAIAAGDGASCEMDVNVNPLRTELCGDVFAICNGRVAMPSTPGLVAPPNPDRLAELTIAA